MRLGYSGTGRGDCPTHLPWQWICLRCCAHWSPRPLQWKVNKTHGSDLFVEVETVPPASGDARHCRVALRRGQMRDLTHVDRSRSFFVFFPPWSCHPVRYLHCTLFKHSQREVLCQVRPDLLSSLPLILFSPLTKTYLVFSFRSSSG